MTNTNTTDPQHSSQNTNSAVVPLALDTNPDHRNDDTYSFLSSILSQGPPTSQDSAPTVTRYTDPLTGITVTRIGGTWRDVNMALSGGTIKGPSSRGQTNIASHGGVIMTNLHPDQVNMAFDGGMIVPYDPESPTPERRRTPSPSRKRPKIRIATFAPATPPSPPLPDDHQEFSTPPITLAIQPESEEEARTGTPPPLRTEPASAVDQGVHSTPPGTRSFPRVESPTTDEPGSLVTRTVGVDGEHTYIADVDKSAAVASENIAYTGRDPGEGAIDNVSSIQDVGECEERKGEDK